ncbi:MAG TPA: type I pullulanase [Victivallales bacterium]|nr:type I pullulanase [Victivallales bacterium]
MHKISRFLLYTLGIIVIILGGEMKALTKNDTIPSAKRAVWAWLDDSYIVTVNIDTPVVIKNMTKNLFIIKDNEGNVRKISKIEDIQTKEIKSDTFKIYLEKPVDNVIFPNFIALENSKKIPVIPRNILNNKKYYYPKNDLGISYRDTGTIFKVWSPTALGIKVKLYDFYNSNKDNFFKSVPLLRKKQGVWSAFIDQDLKNKYYLYEITQYYDGEIKTFLVQDPYSVASAVNSSKSMVIDMNDVNREVPAWHLDEFVGLKNNVDAVIYEAHVRDFSISGTAGSPTKDKGRYSGLSVYNTQNPDGYATGLDHLINLGITHLHLLPTLDYGYGDEAENNITYTWYNWGYDPVLYNNLEGSYSTNPNGITRYIEYKKMIQALHTAGIGVIYDAVFNHTYRTGYGDLSVFDKIVPYYYYRTKYNGKYDNGSGCGNDIASERPMVRKYIVDTAKYLTKEYHIDGFRFDLMGLMDKETMLEIFKEVKSINPNAILYGEGWQISSGILIDDSMTQTNVQNTGIAAFNDGIRNSIVGNILINDSKGFVQGAKNKQLIDRLKQEIKGQSTGSGKKSIPVTAPSETVNYVSSHDNLCLWDKLKASMPKADDEKLLKMDKLAIGMVMTSQGVPFFAEGDDFGRTKRGNDNSYNDNDPTINPINWKLKTKNYSLFEYYKGLISLRKSHPAFRMTNKNDVNNHLEFLKNSPPGVIAYVLKHNANNDEWKNILVAFNNTGKDVTITIVGDWSIVVDGKQAGISSISMVQDTLTVPAFGMLLAHTNNVIDSFEY